MDLEKAGTIIEALDSKQCQGYAYSFGCFKLNNYYFSRISIKLADLRWIFQGIGIEEINSKRLLFQNSERSNDQREFMHIYSSGGVQSAHCAGVIPRMYDLNAMPGTTDSSLDTTFANLLRTLCPSDESQTFVRELDATNGTFDNEYFKVVKSQRGLTVPIRCCPHQHPFPLQGREHFSQVPSTAFWRTSEHRRWKCARLELVERSDKWSLLSTRVKLLIYQLQKGVKGCRLVNLEIDTVWLHHLFRMFSAQVSNSLVLRISLTRETYIRAWYVFVNCYLPTFFV